jgi:3-oxoacyl-[acyl-carrier protein] reductase
MSNQDLKDKVVVVTGASRGIGEAVTREFLKLGARVARCSRSGKLNFPEADNSKFFEVDVSKKVEVVSAITKIMSTFGRIDVLVNNAGIRSPPMSTEEYDEGKFLEMWNTNFMGTLYMTLAALPHLKKTKGCIINMSSASGFANSVVGSTFYAVTKAAINVFTKRLAIEVGNYGIRVNAVAPGAIKTAMSMRGKTGEELRKLQELQASLTMLRMVGEPEHVAGVVTFLASKSADYITGQVIIVDGGKYDYL